MIKAQADLLSAINDLIIAINAAGDWSETPVETKLNLLNSAISGMLAAENYTYDTEIARNTRWSGIRGSNSPLR